MSYGNDKNEKALVAQASLLGFGSPEILTAVIKFAAEEFGNIPMALRDLSSATSYPLMYIGVLFLVCEAGILGLSQLSILHVDADLRALAILSVGAVLLVLGYLSRLLGFVRKSAMDRELLNALKQNTPTEFK